MEIGNKYEKPLDKLGELIEQAEGKYKHHSPKEIFDILKEIRIQLQRIENEN